MWAFGVTLWEILNFAGVRPHADLSEAEVCYCNKIVFKDISYNTTYLKVGKGIWEEILFEKLNKLRNYSNHRRKHILNDRWKEDYGIKEKKRKENLLLHI